MTARALDVICIGRAGVDFYGEQVGGRLEDMNSFAKYVGGSPTNTAIGAARLGLKAALITRVGDEHMGRFIRETLLAEGVDVSHVKTDPGRLTALVILGIRNKETFPLIFHRENCADMAISPDDFDRAFIASAQALLTSGTHFSTPGVDAASRAAIRHARASGTKVALDIDYRPVLWGLTGHGLGEERYVGSETVTTHLQSIVAECDLIVGTEEEIHVAGGTTDTLGALRAIRQISAAAIVLKRGPMGCAVFPDAIPDDIDDGVKGPGFPIEVFNVLGAGDGFMGGFLRGWLRDEPWETCCAYANACGAFAVSRHACAPSYPSWTELADFLANGSSHYRLREDRRIEQLHWSTTRTRDLPEICALAFDHRSQFEVLAREHGRPETEISRFKGLIWKAVRAAPEETARLGILCDDRFGQDVLDRATGTGHWIGRPIELPGSRPLEFEGAPDVAVTLREWPVEHCVKCLVYYHPDDPPDLRAAQDAQLRRLLTAARQTRHELLLEVITPPDSPVDSRTLANAINAIYEIGVYPDWWKLKPPDDDDAWRHITAAVQNHDPYCRGILLLGLEAPEQELAASFKAAASYDLCRGFAVGRSIFGPAARAWFAGEMSDRDATANMSGRFSRLIELWRGRSASGGSTWRRRRAAQ